MKIQVVKKIVTMSIGFEATIGSYMEKKSMKFCELARAAIREYMERHP